MIVPESEMRGFHGFLDTLQKCRVEDGRGDFRLSVAVGISFDTPPQSDLP